MSNHVHHGVADYFAIVGVGEKLTWKHTQKQNSGNGEDNDHSDAEKERFYREIVDVAIIDMASQPDKSSANVVSSQTSLSESESATSSQPAIAPALSPTLTDNSATTADTSNQMSAMHPKLSGAIVTQPDGWNIVRETMPSAEAVLAPIVEGVPPIQLWNAHSTWDANLEWNEGIGGQFFSHYQNAMDHMTGEKSSLAGGIRQKVQSTLRHKFQQLAVVRNTKSSAEYCTTVPLPRFYVAFKRRQDPDRIAVADCQLWYVRLHRDTLPMKQGKHKEKSESTTPLSGLANHFFDRYHSPFSSPRQDHEEAMESSLVNLRDYLSLPTGFDEWSIPDELQWLRDPASCGSDMNTRAQKQLSSTTTVILGSDNRATSPSGGIGVEVVDTDNAPSREEEMTDPKSLWPKLVERVELTDNDCPFFFVPTIAIRRQRVGDEESYHEDPAMVDLSVTLLTRLGEPLLPVEDHDVFDQEDDGTFTILGKTKWSLVDLKHTVRSEKRFGMPVMIVRKNLPFGFADAAFATSVLSRFPKENYKGLPLPEEELPMFCYPSGCRLFRARLSEAPVTQYYGFVVKNERGDSIYVSCVSFMEPLTPSKIRQLEEMSLQRESTSLPNRLKTKSGTSGSHLILTSYDETVTFENKTICIISRYPFWTAFRKYLLNLHLVSGVAAKIPLERYISHLLLAVPLPKAGGQSVLVPLPALSEPMILALPAQRDFPPVDLAYQTLFSCLDVKMVVTIVLSLLVLERKVILLSTRPSLVLDVSELLRSLMFPFELCAPYVPRLTEPFKSSLDFPGAIFVGIHDDGSPDGLAASVKANCPEASIIVDLDTGSIDCDGDPVETIGSAWDVIPSKSRTTLVSELEALCGDANIVDGQEPLDSLFDSSFDVALSSAVNDLGIVGSTDVTLFDDRCVRDSFLRFFCSILGGYEQCLVVPDADFLVSGNEWFDAKTFLAMVPSHHSAYVNALVATQLFQSFIQRRTEASDVHCLLFDDCLQKFHSNPVPYGRLGSDLIEVNNPGPDEHRYMYSLLVDQCAALEHNTPAVIRNKSFDTEGEVSMNASKVSLSGTYGTCAETQVNADGDLISAPTLQELPPGGSFSYIVGGLPSFPDTLCNNYFLPSQPNTFHMDTADSSGSVLTRSPAELEDCNRRKRSAVSQNSNKSQSRCLWQLPKLLGSHFLGAWLMCIPAQVRSVSASPDYQSTYIARALGTLRHLRSKQRIVPDEAAYRALIVACGRSSGDRRVEVVKLFGLLRADGIFPSAVTLGQYTKALAEGYSKRSVGAEGQANNEQTKPVNSIGHGSPQLDKSNMKFTDLVLHSLDPSLKMLEEFGRTWRQKSSKRKEDSKRQAIHNWLPTATTASVVPGNYSLQSPILVSLWSRTTACPSCRYIPLEEETQAGWESTMGRQVLHSIDCPRCGAGFVPMLGIREMTVKDALEYEQHHTDVSESVADFQYMPPQIRPYIDEADGISKFVVYMNPIALRVALEEYIDEVGEESLHRDSLRQSDPDVFYNLMWFCARFGLPLPLPLEQTNEHQNAHYFGFAAWDKAAADRGCWSAARVLHAAQQGHDKEFFMSEDHRLLSRFNLQGFFSSVWDHDDLSKILVTLVEACDKRDFRPVIESVIIANARRRALFQGHTKTNVQKLSVELDMYRTILYLAKYQCTSAFHAFFPTTAKACKGYHFWCTNATPFPMFDRLVRDGMQRSTRGKSDEDREALRTVSELALGFRCVFGHLI